MEGMTERKLEMIIPAISVGVMDGQPEVSGRLNGLFTLEGAGPASGRFSATVEGDKIILSADGGRTTGHAPFLRLEAQEGSTFTLFDVTIGKTFHWERREEQTFHGNILLRLRPDGTLAVINEIGLEDYLASVISSEMSGSASSPFLRAHAILSRSWLMAALSRKGQHKEASSSPPTEGDAAGEILRWYEREEHDLYDVCADDHCQRYQGITKILSKEAGEAVEETRGMVLTFDGMVCDARYSKACGGRTEEFQTAWDDRPVPYLVSIADGPVDTGPLRTEEEARQWVLSEPEAYCGMGDEGLLATILPDFDRETKGFFRWSVTYEREELEEILREKSGLDVGRLEDVVPLQRGPSGRISRLRIKGSKRSVVVGKELEIRRWLSKSHLKSSAFVVTVPRDPEGVPERFIFYGAGWGHGVGLCQIGAAVMASKGFTAEEILHHYFPGAKIEQAY
jgi:stage II sporulation protein D